MASRMIQNNFSGGEISPSLYGRSDLQAYYKGCAVAENFIVSKEGTLRKRHGLVRVGEISIEDYDCAKIIPYKFDRSMGGFFIVTGEKDDTSGLITKHSFALYDKSGNKIGDTKSIEANGDLGSVKDYQYKQIGDQIWISNGTVFRILTVSNFDGTSDRTFTIDTWKQAPIPASIPYHEVNKAKPTTGYITDETKTHWFITRSQVADTLKRTMYYGCYTKKDSVLSSGSLATCKWYKTWVANASIDIGVILTKEDYTSGKWDSVLVGKRTGGSYGQLSEFYIDGEPDRYFAHTGTDKKITDAMEIYKWSDGKFYNKPEGASEATEITDGPSHYLWVFTDENHQPEDIIQAQTNVLGEGFDVPLCVDCFQQRRVFANAETVDGDEATRYPMTLWFSEVGNLNNFYANRPTTASDPFSPTIASSGPSFINHVVSYDQYMILLTRAGLFSLGFSEQQGFSATSCRVSKFSDLASSPDIQPVVSEAGVVFVGADNKTVYTIAYDIQSNKLHAVNRSVLVEHLTRDAPIRSIALQDYPDNTVWVVTADGKACSFTIERDEQVYSWSHSKIFGKTWDFRDCIGLGTATDGADGRTRGDILFVVDISYNDYRIFTFGDEWKDVLYGDTSRPISARLVTLRPESQERTIVGQKKNVLDVLVRVKDTGLVKVRTPDGDDLPFVPAHKPETPDGLYTGDIKGMPRGAVNEDGQIELVSDDDKPCEILQVVTTVEVT